MNLDRPLIQCRLSVYRGMRNVDSTLIVSGLNLNSDHELFQVLRAMLKQCGDFSSSVIEKIMTTDPLDNVSEDDYRYISSYNRFTFRAEPLKITPFHKVGAQ